MPYAFAWPYFSDMACNDRCERQKSIVRQLWGKYPDGLKDVGNGHGREGQRIFALSFPDALPGMRCRFARINGKMQDGMMWPLLWSLIYEPKKKGRSGVPRWSVC